MASTRPILPEEWAVLEKCYEAKRKDLYKSARATLQSEHLAEDIVQDTFTYAADHIDSFMESPNPEGWLYKAMGHLIQHALRTRQRLLVRNIPLEDVMDLTTNEDGYEINELDMESEDMQLIARYFAYGWSLAELAEQYGISVSAVKMRINRAKKRLQNDPNIQDLKNFYF